ncbi:PHP domain-containing protein [Streptosporangium canum]|uniref:PHP domain-containing protein n=1 Tax=Streptosporangium canum TaxID=324952 RepID=UPI00368F9389
MRIDLHAHSTASDGTAPPGALAEKAAVAGLDVVALTDHDTTAGWETATGTVPLAGASRPPTPPTVCSTGHRAGSSTRSTATASWRSNTTCSRASPPRSRSMP